MTDKPNPQDEIRESVARARCERIGLDWRDLIDEAGSEVSAEEARRNFRDEAAADIAAHNRALAKAGLVIVPREPSEGMVEAAAKTDGLRAVDNLVVLAFAHGMKLPEGQQAPLFQAWRAMIAKAEEEMDEKRG